MGFKASPYFSHFFMPSLKHIKTKETKKTFRTWIQFPDQGNCIAGCSVFFRAIILSRDIGLESHCILIYNTKHCTTFYIGSGCFLSSEYHLKKFKQHLICWNGIWKHQTDKRWPKTHKVHQKPVQVGYSDILPEGEKTLLSDWAALEN